MRAVLRIGTNPDGINPGIVQIISHPVVEIINTALGVALCRHAIGNEIDFLIKARLEFNRAGEVERCFIVGAAALQGIERIQRIQNRIQSVEGAIANKSRR